MNSTMPSSQLFLKDDHIRYFASALHEIPAPYAKLDSNRLTLVHFATHALDLLGVWDDRVAQDCLQIKPQRIIDWIHNLQLLQGFEGGSYVGPVSMSEEGSYNIAPNEYHQGHIAMTYTALCTLRTLGDDLSRINRQTILESMRRLQREDGSFQCTLVASEHDMRFLYCACAISYMLQDWSAVNIDLAVDYIRSCRAYDGGISLIPGQEGHGGSTFCGVAALRLMGHSLLEDDLAWRDELIYWCVHRQEGGMQGRPNKAEDTCYSYWIGGTLRLLGQDHLLDAQALREYVLSCQSKQLGGFGKVVGAFPDLLHSFYSLAYLSLSNSIPSSEDEKATGDPFPVHALNCTLGIRQERAVLFHGIVIP